MELWLIKRTTSAHNFRRYEAGVFSFIAVNKVLWGFRYQCRSSRRDATTSPGENSVSRKAYLWDKVLPLPCLRLTSCRAIMCLCLPNRIVLLVLKDVHVIKDIFLWYNNFIKIEISIMKTRRDHNFAKRQTRFVMSFLWHGDACIKCICVHF